MRVSGFAMADCLMALLIVMVGVVGVVNIRRQSLYAWQNARYREIAIGLIDQVLAEDVRYWETDPERCFDFFGKPNSDNGVFCLSLQPGQPSQGTMTYKDAYDQHVEIQFVGPFSEAVP